MTVCPFLKSFVKGVKKGGRKVYDTAKEENLRRKERAVERKERRLERKVSGVDMDVKLEKDTAHKENMTELLEKKKTVKEEVFLSPEMAEIPIQQEFKKKKTYKPDFWQNWKASIPADPPRTGLPCP